MAVLKDLHPHAAYRSIYSEQTLSIWPVDLPVNRLIIDYIKPCKYREPPSRLALLWDAERGDCGRWRIPLQQVLGIDSAPQRRETFSSVQSLIKVGKKATTPSTAEREVKENPVCVSLPFC